MSAYSSLVCTWRAWKGQACVHILMSPHRVVMIPCPCSGQERRPWGLNRPGGQAEADSKRSPGEEAATGLTVSMAVE